MGDKFKVITDITSQYKCGCNDRASLKMKIIILTNEIKQINNNTIIFYCQKKKYVENTYPTVILR